MRSTWSLVWAPLTPANVCREGVQGCAMHAWVRSTGSAKFGSLAATNGFMSSRCHNSRL
jgi:hypothetical protein